MSIQLFLLYVYLKALDIFQLISICWFMTLINLYAYLETEEPIIDRFNSLHVE
jgi:hypothetical protein